MTACGTIVHANDYTLQYMSQQSQINSYITVQAAVENPTASHLWLGRAVLCSSPCHCPLACCPAKISLPVSVSPLVGRGSGYLHKTPSYRGINV